MQALDCLEIFTLHLETPPLATEWVMWVPREHNRAADWLASRALLAGTDRWFWHAWWRRYQHDSVILLSDARVRQSEGEARAGIGLGWLLVHRESRCILAAASWFVQGEEEAAEEDVNYWELRALVAGLGALLFLRTGRVGEVRDGAGVEGGVLSTEERRLLRRLL